MRLRTERSNPLGKIDFFREHERGCPIGKPHQVHMAFEIEHLSQNDWHLLKPAAARMISYRPA